MSLSTTCSNFPQFCDGVTVDYDDERGRFVKALRDLPVGTVVCVEEGVVVNISAEHCYKCLTKLEDVSQKYCKNCEKFDEPDELANGDFDDLGLFKLAAHIVMSYPLQQVMEIMRSADPVLPNDAPSKLATSDFDSIMQLRPMPQIGDAFQDQHIQKSISKMVKLLSNHSKWGKLDDEMRWIVFSKALRLVAERSAKNSHVIYSIEQSCRATDEEPLGTGMFPMSSIFNHSCTPNVFSFFDRNRFIFVSRGVRAGEELVDSYGVTYLQNTFAKRKEFLSQVSGFECNCMKCSKEESLNEFLLSGLKDAKKVAESSPSILDIDQLIDFIEPGNKDIETLIQLFSAKDDARDHHDKLRELWKLFVTNANIRGIKFDEYLVRPYLEQIILLADSSERSNLLFTVHQILHCLFADLHPASRIINQLVKETSKSTSNELESDLKTLVRKMWPA